MVYTKAFMAKCLILTQIYLPKSQSIGLKLYDPNPDIFRNAVIVMVTKIVFFQLMMRHIVTTAVPPEYPLGNITSLTIALYRGLNDPLADSKDVEQRVARLVFYTFLSICVTIICFNSEPAGQLYSAIFKVESPRLSAWNFPRILC